LNFEPILGGPRDGAGSGFKLGIGVSSVPTGSSKIQILC